MRNLFLVLLFVFGFGSVAYAESDVISIQGFRMDMTLNEQLTLAQQVCEEQHEAFTLQREPDGFLFAKCYDGMFDQIEVFHEYGKTFMMVALLPSTLSLTHAALVKKYGPSTKMPQGRTWRQPNVFFFMDFHVQLKSYSGKSLVTVYSKYNAMPHNYRLIFESLNNTNH